MKIAVVLTARPSWAKLSSVCAALAQRPDVELQIVACASALLARYGRVVDIVKAEGYPVAAECWTVHEGANLHTSVKETGALATELAGVLARLRPDYGLVVADRHEVLAAAQAIAYQHIPLIHLQGGERTGSIDDKVRDCITHLADYHFPATECAKWRVYGLTGSDRIWNVGCPSVDLARQALADPMVTHADLGGTGPVFSLVHPFLIVLQHPVTGEANDAAAQMQTTLAAISRIRLPRIVFASGEDAGADEMAHAVRMWRHAHPELSIYTVKNFSPRRFLRLLSQASVLVGNSSVGIREGSFLGVPVVNIGSRQNGRERAENVRDVPHDVEAMTTAISQQIAHGPYVPSYRYGRGDAGTRMAEIVCGLRDGEVLS